VTGKGKDKGMQRPGAGEGEMKDKGKKVSRGKKE